MSSLPDPAPTTGRRTSLLESLLDDALDPGYAEAARRKADRVNATLATGTPSREPGRRRFGGGDRALLVGGCALLGFLLVVAYLHTTRAAPTDARTRADLRGRILSAERDGDALDHRAQSLGAQADALRRAALGSGGDDGALARAEAAAATIPVRGPGVRIELGNPAPPTSGASSGRAGRTPIGAVATLTDTDVRAVVNELWHDGAEAIAVNGVRLSATSAIRFAGEAVLVDFRPVTSPYAIEAIGDSNRLITAFTDSAVAARYRTLASADGFTFASTEIRRITLAASVAPAPRYARGSAALPTGPPATTRSPSPAGPS